MREPKELRVGRDMKIVSAPHSHRSIRPSPRTWTTSFTSPSIQIMRQRLLADRMVHEGELEIDEAKVVVVVPEQNWAYRTVSDGKTTTSPLLAKRFPQLKTVEDVMRTSLKVPDAQFDMVAPSSLLEAVSQCLPGETDEWACYWRTRYGV